MKMTEILKNRILQDSYLTIFPKFISSMHIYLTSSDRLQQCLSENISCNEDVFLNFEYKLGKFFKKLSYLYIYILHFQIGFKNACQKIYHTMRIIFVFEIQIRKNLSKFSFLLVFFII